MRRESSEELQLASFQKEMIGQSDKVKALRGRRIRALYSHRQKQFTPADMELYLSSLNVSLGDDALRPGIINLTTKKELSGDGWGAMKVDDTYAHGVLALVNQNHWVYFKPDEYRRHTQNNGMSRKEFNEIYNRTICSDTLSCGPAALSHLRTYVADPSTQLAGPPPENQLDIIRQQTANFVTSNYDAVIAKCERPEDAASEGLLFVQQIFDSVRDMKFASLPSGLSQPSVGAQDSDTGRDTKDDVGDEEEERRDDKAKETFKRALGITNEFPLEIQVKDTDANSATVVFSMKKDQSKVVFSATFSAVEGSVGMVINEVRDSGDPERRKLALLKSLHYLRKKNGDNPLVVNESFKTYVKSLYADKEDVFAEFLRDNGITLVPPADSGASPHCLWGQEANNVAQEDRAATSGNHSAALPTKHSGADDLGKVGDAIPGPGLGLQI